jgi:hypothetical protein
MRSPCLAVGGRRGQASAEKLSSRFCPFTGKDVLQSKANAAMIMVEGKNVINLKRSNK